MSMTAGVIPRCWQTSRASASDADDDVRYGMRMGSTLSGPSAMQAMAALRAESTPPDRPTTTRSKPTRMSPTTALSIASVSGLEAVCLGVVDVMSFIPKQWVGDAGAPHGATVDAVENQLLMVGGGLVEEAAVWGHHACPTPEANP